jgi:hypothetical protein
MKTLHLVMKKIYFDQILNGSKKDEIRTLRPKSASKYLDYTTDEKGEVAVPKHFDLLRLYMGYETNRPYFDVEVKDSILAVLLDENENEIVYVENGIEYIEAQIEYSLGNIVFKHNC